MKILTFLFLTFYILISYSYGKSSVSKQKSIEIGYKNNFNFTFENKATSGMMALFDYAWQLSGVDGTSKASFISVPIGYAMLIPNTNNDKLIKILSYGWAVRHELANDKKIIPFLGYALLLNQLSIDETEGQVFGHQTKFDFGINILNPSYVIPYFKLEYSFTRYPSLGNKKSDKIQSFEIKGGIRF